jgi:hypothetical protein
MSHPIVLLLQWILWFCPVQISRACFVSSNAAPALLDVDGPFPRGGWSTMHVFGSAVNVEKGLIDAFGEQENIAHASTHDWTVSAPWGLLVCNAVTAAFPSTRPFAPSPLPSTVPLPLLSLYVSRMMVMRRLNLKW